MQVAWDRNTSSMKGKQNKVWQNWDKPSSQYFQYKLSNINSIKLFFAILHFVNLVHVVV